MPTSMSTSDIIALIALVLAVYGAILSTIIAIRDLWKDRRRVNLDCKISFTAGSAGLSEDLIEISAVNIGHRPIEIIGAGIRTSNGYRLMIFENALGPIPFPKKLEDGERVAVYIALSEAQRALTKSKDGLYTKAFVRDNEGKEYITSLPKIMKQRGLAK